VRPYLKKTLHKKRDGGVAQGEALSSSPSTAKTTTKKSIHVPSTMQINSLKLTGRAEVECRREVWERQTAGKMPGEPQWEEESLLGYFSVGNPRYCQSTSPWRTPDFFGRGSIPAQP
jgi:hypothetical protein